MLILTYDSTRKVSVSSKDKHFEKQTFPRVTFKPMACRTVAGRSICILNVADILIDNNVNPTLSDF